MSKDGFYVYENYRNIAKSLPDDLRVKFYDALMDYALDGIESDDGIIKALITAIKPSIDKVENRGGSHNPTGQNQYTKGQKEVKSGQSCSNEGQKEVKSGQSGQSFIKQETRNKKQETITPVILPQDKSFGNISPLKGENPTIDEVVDIEELIAEQKLKEVKDKVKRFKKPTIDEVVEYCRANRYDVDANKFWNFYESKGWKVGKNPMKDWRASVRTWVRNTDKPPEQTVEQKQRESEERLKLINQMLGADE